MSKTAKSMIVPVVALLMWEYFSSFSPYATELRPVFPAPSKILYDAWQLIQTGELIVHIANSLYRVFGGLFIATVIGIPLGLMIGFFALVDDLLDPVIEFLRPIPPPAWIPLGILWFGIGNAQNMFVIFLGAFFPIVLNTIAGVRLSDPLLIAAARTLGASERQVVSQIILPGAVPTILVGLRIGLGMGWMALVAAELVAGRSGLGFLIQSSRYAFLTERIFVGMITIGLLGLAMDMVMRVIQRRALGWATS